MLRHAHRSQCRAEIDKVDAGDKNNQEPDTYQQGHGTTAACLKVVGRIHVIIQFLYRENIEFLGALIPGKQSFVGFCSCNLLVDFFHADSWFQQEECKKVLTAPVVLLKFSHRNKEVIFELAVFRQVFKNTAYSEFGGFRISPVWSICVQIGT